MTNIMPDIWSLNKPKQYIGISTRNYQQLCFGSYQGNFFHELWKLINNFHMAYSLIIDIFLCKSLVTTPTKYQWKLIMKQNKIYTSWARTSPQAVILARIGAWRKFSRDINSDKLIIHHRLWNLQQGKHWHNWWFACKSPIDKIHYPDLIHDTR